MKASGLSLRVRVSVNPGAHSPPGWRAVARGLGMRGTDLLDFEPAFVESITP